MKIIADNKIPFLQGALEPFAEIKYLPGNQISKTDVTDAQALIVRTRTQCNAGLLDGSTVKIITSATIGYDHIDVEWCEANNIRWTNAPGCNSGSVMQYIAAVLAFLVEEKEWQLKGKKIAIVGVGNVGSKVSALAKTLGMEVYEVDPPRARKEPNKTFYKLSDVAPIADIITFHTPLTREGADKTFHLYNDQLQSRLKPNVVVINSSRGEVINSQTLKQGLTAKQVGLAILDVWENEPQIDLELLSKTWIATPHIAGYSQDGKANGTMMSVQAISRELNLGIDHWQPQALPEPNQPELIIDCHQQSLEKILTKAIRHTYDIMADDRQLRADPSLFEKLRGDYPVRREFHAFKILLQNGTPTHAEALKQLGFKMVRMI
ncbi:4-phosphoerythronate dehydrogenase [Marinilabiliaceae bacterium JC017]|nr:4-phosphoerythronate dehydrogenase [Marinilabiliaceae bacterium JC017]